MKNRLKKANNILHDGIVYLFPRSNACERCMKTKDLVKWWSQKCALDTLDLWSFTNQNPLPKRKALNEQVFKEQPDEQLKKGDIIHRIDVDKHQTIGFGFTMLFGYSRLIAVKKCRMDTQICELQQEEIAIPIHI